MEILLDLDIYESVSIKDTQEVSESEKEIIKKKIGFDDVKNIKIVNIGPGADFLVLFISFSTALYLFLKVGTVINDGINAWIEIGKKLNKLFYRRKIVSVDIEGATALAIGFIAKREKITTLEKMNETVINLVDVSVMILNNSKLCKKPHNYYIQTYRINGEDVYVIGIKSNGEVNLIKHFGFNPYGITDIKTK